jgi:hypothetical protein
LILFGSCVKSCFVIDTVFVVKDIIPYFIPVSDNIYFSELNSESNIYTEIVLKMSCKNQSEINKKSRILYIGASYADTDESVNKMFSFVPSIKYEGKKEGFPRLFLPNVENINNYYSKWTGDKKIINNNLKQGLIHNYIHDIKEITKLWEIIKNRTLEKNVLGYNFEIPKENEIIKL